MKNQPLFSIATPCWNSASTIERTIKSVLAQDYKNYEYIIVDGGSTDGTIDIIKKYEPLFEGRMKWKSERDKGIYDAFNKGVERSSGVYCWNVNADDYIEPEALSHIAKYLDGYPECVIVGGMNNVSEEGNIIDCVMPTNEIIERIYANDSMIPHPATIVHKEVYNKYGGFDTNFRLAADMDWFHRVYRIGVKFLCPGVIITNMSMGGLTFHHGYLMGMKEIWRFKIKKHHNPLKAIEGIVKWHIRKLFKLIRNR